MSSSQPAKMQIRPLRLAGMWETVSERFRDNRGYLSRTFDDRVFSAHGLEPRWIQHIIQLTEKQGTVRGMHVQVKPYTETKLIRPLRGKMWWVSVDMRRASPTFRQWEGIELDADKDNGLFVQPGFAHGCVSTSDDMLLSILADNYFSPAHGAGFRWDDPELAIRWPVANKLISEAHAAQGSFRDCLAEIGGGL